MPAPLAAPERVPLLLSLLDVAIVVASNYLLQLTATLWAIA